jgi:hypothetical protein
MVQNFRREKEEISFLYQPEQFKTETKAQLTDCFDLFLSQQLKKKEKS